MALAGKRQEEACHGMPIAFHVLPYGRQLPPRTGKAGPVPNFLLHAAESGSSEQSNVQAGCCQRGLRVGEGLHVGCRVRALSVASEPPLEPEAAGAM